MGRSSEELSNAASRGSIRSLVVEIAGMSEPTPQAVVGMEIAQAVPGELAPRWCIPGPCPPIGWESFAPPPAICQTDGPILDPKMAFDSTGPELSKYAVKFLSKRH